MLKKTKVNEVCIYINMVDKIMKISNQSDDDLYNSFLF